MAARGAPGADAQAAFDMFLRGARHGNAIRELMASTGCTFGEAETSVRVANRMQGTEFTFLGPDGLPMEDFDV